MISKKRPNILVARPSLKLNDGVLSLFCFGDPSFSLFDEDLSDLVSSFKVLVLNWFLVTILYYNAFKRKRKVSRYKHILKTVLSPKVRISPKVGKMLVHFFHNRQVTNLTDASPIFLVLLGL